MAEEIQTQKSGRSAPSGRLHPLVVLWRRYFGPKPPPPEPVWTGQCECCGRELKSYDRVFPDGAKVECLACLVGISTEGQKREEDRRQIELYKQAIREVEKEKHNDKDQATDGSVPLVEVLPIITALRGMMVGRVNCTCENANPNSQYHSRWCAKKVAHDLLAAWDAARAQNVKVQVTAD